MARRPFSGEEADPCPICYEEITHEEEEAGELDWCRHSCGKSLHRACLAKWAEHQCSSEQKLTCPHCRGAACAGHGREWTPLRRLEYAATMCANAGVPGLERERR